MATNAANARIFGSDLDAIFLAPLGTQLPTTIDEKPAAGFTDIGWLHSDGIKETPTGEKTVIRGHQGAGVVRSRMEEPGTTFEFIALETTPLTQSLRYSEIEVDTSKPGVRKVTRSPGQKVTAVAAIIDIYDADDVTVKERYVIPRLEVAANGERVFVNNDIAGFPFVAEVIGSYEHYAFAADSSPVEPAANTVEGGQ